MVNRMHRTLFFPHRPGTRHRAAAVKKFTALSLFLMLSASGALAQPLPKNQTLVTKETLTQVATGKLSAPANTYWLGQVFPLTHVLAVDKRLYGNLAGSLTLGGGAFNAEDWSRPVSGAAGDRVTLTQTSRAYATQAGSQNLPAATQAVILLTRINEGSFAAGTETDTFTVTSNSPGLTIRPLPAPAPAAFGGAVGEFELSSTVASTSTRVGEAVAWTIKVSGTGNWPEIRALPARAVPREFDYVKPVLTRNLKPETLFDGDMTDELVLMPTKAGTYQLGPVRFVYFNPREGKYQMLTSETIHLTVAPAGPGGVVAGASGVPAERILVAAVPPTLPLDPQRGDATGLAPWSPGAVAWTCLVAPVVFLVYWLRRAAQRRWVTDAWSARRAARGRIVALVDSLKADDPPAGAELRWRFFEWQRAVAEFAGVKVSVPTPAQIAAAMESAAPGSPGTSWAELWRESNRVIFSPVPKVPPGWAHRAKAAIVAATLPEVPVWHLFRRQNLFPGLAFVVVMLLPWVARADVGGDAYRAGDFAGAEKAWTAAAAKDPANANLRYNLSLAAAQQDRWSESAAHALAAFCLEPASPEIRWQFQLSLDRAGIEHPFLAPLAHGTGFGGVARMFSPAGWGLWAVAASIVCALALGGAAWAAYGGKPRAWSRVGLALAALAFVGCAVALAGLRAYGPLADRDIAVVAQSTLLASVPTEADTGQKTVPLPAGSLAKVDGQFLTWSRLHFANDQTGWVRTKLITFLYRAPGKSF